MRKAGVVLLAAAAAAAVVLRRRKGSPERVELGFVDGSAVSLRPSDGNAERLLALARDVASAARS
jgi:CHASE2 domain-containing sensor protein